MKRDYIAEAIDYIEKNFTEKRRVHTYGVREEALKLCDFYGADRHKAEIAALFHDLVRDLDNEQTNALIEKYGLDRARYMNNRNLAHSKIAAEMMRREFGIDDEEILNAVSYHTTGRPGMSLLEKVIFIADACEKNRTYPGVDDLRAVEFEGLDGACLLSMERTLRHVAERGETADPDTVAAAEYLRKH